MLSESRGVGTLILLHNYRTLAQIITTLLHISSAHYTYISTMSLDSPLPYYYIYYYYTIIHTITILLRIPLHTIIFTIITLSYHTYIITTSLDIPLPHNYIIT